MKMLTEAGAIKVLKRLGRHAAKELEFSEFKKIVDFVYGFSHGSGADDYIMAWDHDEKRELDIKIDGYLVEIVFAPVESGYGLRSLYSTGRRGAELMQRYYPPLIELIEEESILVRDREGDDPPW